MKPEDKLEDKTFLTKKTKRSYSYSEKTHKSDGSGDYAFSNRNNSAFTIRHCSNFKRFKEYFSQIKNPYYTSDINFLESSGILGALKNKDLINKEIKFSIPFEKIDKAKIFPIKMPQNFFKNKEKNTAGNFVFSNLLKSEEINEGKRFKDIHDFDNGYFHSCQISDFCIDSNLHFKNNKIDKFYKIKSDDFFIRSIKVFHYHLYGIGHFYAPKGAGKSILFRSIFINFINYENDPDRYTPLMFFDIKLLNDLVSELNIDEIKNILLHESYSLFKEREKAINFIEKINFNSYKNNLMQMIHEIIIIALNEIKEEQKVFVLDGYSCEYDSKNILNEIKKDVINKQNFFLVIIYDVKTLKDAEILYKNINSEHHINYNTDEINKYFYFAKLKLFSELRQNFKENEIPEKYSEIFGENVSYFFEYQKDKNNITFDDFVTKKHNQIKEEIINFFINNGNYYLNEIEKLIETQEKFLYNEILKFIPANYIEINIEPKPDPKYSGENYLDDVIVKKYSLDYCFPLVNKVVKEILKSQGLINMKSDEFLNLPGGALGTNFDIEMNRILKELMKEKNFFEHTKKVQINIENIFEKNSNNKRKIYEYNDVVLEVNKYYKKDKKNFDKIDFNSFTCIGVFQNEFCGKAFDILFFTKKENDKLYNMNLIQVKCSNSYVEKKEEELIPQIIYVYNKFSYLLKIKIKNIFLLYLSIYQKPKFFAESNSDKSFLYNVKTDKFVDFNNIEYKEFPFLPDSIIYFDTDSIIISSIIRSLSEKYYKIINLIKKEKNVDNFRNKKHEEIKDSLSNDEVYVYVSSPVFNYYYKIGEYFGYIITTVPIVYEGIYENLFEIKY